MFLIPRILSFLAIALAAAPPVAGAAWRDEITTLRVGVLGEEDAAYRITTLEPFRVYLQDKTGIPVEIVPIASYGLLIDAQAAGEIDYAIYSATAYATAVVKCACVEAIAAPLSADGALGFHSVLVARADDGIADLAGAADRRLAIGPGDSVSASIVPRHAFTAEGIDPATYFGSVAEYASPEDAVAALLDDEVDLAAAWSSLSGREATGYSFGTFTRMVADETLSMDDIRIVWRSSLIPFGPHAIRASLPGELKGIISGAVLAMAGEDPEALDAVDRAGFGGGGFASPDESLYALVIALVTPPAAE